jgi:hypothetical protein
LLGFLFAAGVFYGSERGLFSWKGDTAGLLWRSALFGVVVVTSGLGLDWLITRGQHRRKSKDSKVVDDGPMGLNERDEMRVGYVDDFYELLRAIDEAMPKGAVLYVEGSSIARDVAAFLDGHKAPDPRRIVAGTKWPKARVFHLPLSGTNLTELRKIAESHAEPEVADHLVVYRDEQVLLSAYDAGSNDIYLWRALPAETITAFQYALGDALQRQP